MTNYNQTSGVTGVQHEKKRWHCCGQGTFEFGYLHEELEGTQWAITGLTQIPECVLHQEVADRLLQTRESDILCKADVTANWTALSAS